MGALRPLLIGFAVTSSLLLTACGHHDPEITPATTDGLIPAITWPYGAPHENDEFAQLARDATTAIAAAWNSGDFSSPALDDSVAESYRWTLARSSNAGSPGRDAGQTGTSYTHYPGPIPLRIDSIERNPNDDTSTIVAACSPGRWENNTGRPEKGDLDWIRTSTVRMFFREEDGAQKLYMLTYGEECTMVDAKLGYFDPQPDYNNAPDPATIVDPDGNLFANDD